ncbi:hypothetical protein OG689_41695 [Kitasatospora sp. NBC_00240]|uniref:hypothetical protein n=1 Tax=Kitasatospora sp. NBC_00240 TaxID=2903567 RepID=UPI00224EB850|nr:hypothetical protein [Kitasatospora sp. NBC_00240]MCX5215672.1 hypothetical protein [Kitasatospora sp. NBC_00240]
MTTALERHDRDRGAAIVDRHPATPTPDAQTVRMDAALLALAGALLSQFAAALDGEPIGLR